LGAVPRLIAHHPSTPTLLVELAVVALVVAVFGGIWLRERRRRADRSRRVAEMRDAP
jgi:exosome complex RNA-binding protein Rrp4